MKSSERGTAVALVEAAMRHFVDTGILRGVGVDATRVRLVEEDGMLVWHIGLGHGLAVPIPFESWALNDKDEDELVDVARRLVRRASQILSDRDDIHDFVLAIRRETRNCQAALRRRGQTSKVPVFRMAPSPVGDDEDVGVDLEIVVRRNEGSTETAMIRAREMGDVRAGLEELRLL